MDPADLPRSHAVEKVGSHEHGTEHEQCVGIDPHDLHERKHPEKRGCAVRPGQDVKEGGYPQQ